VAARSIEVHASFSIYKKQHREAFGARTVLEQFVFARYGYGYVGDDIEKNKAEVELYYYIKNKQPEIKARLEPNFYLSINKNQSNFERMIANVKWGFPSPNSDKTKRYITLYLGNNKLHYKDLKANDAKNDFVSTVSDMLNKLIPFEFNPPNLE
jgi:hypothetical protein